MGRILRGLAVVAVAGVAMVGGASNATASETLPRECLANGSVTANPLADGTASWSVDGSGTCTGDFGGTYLVSLHGTGSSNGLSQCTGGLVTTDFSLAVDVTVSNLVGSKTFHQTWSLPVDNYSARTAFLIGGQGLGAGYIGHNIFLACPGHGSPSASFLFSFLG